MQMAGEEQNLLSFLCDRNQGFNGCLGSALIEVDEDIVQDHGKLHTVIAETFEHCQSDRQEELFPGATAQFADCESVPFVVVDFRILFQGSPDITVFPIG